MSLSGSLTSFLTVSLSLTVLCQDCSKKMLVIWVEIFFLEQTFAPSARYLMFNVLGLCSWNSSNAPRLSWDNQKCSHTFLTYPVEAGSVVFWHVLALICQACSRLRTVMFALDLPPIMFHVTFHFSVSISLSPRAFPNPHSEHLPWYYFLFFFLFPLALTGVKPLWEGDLILHFYHAHWHAGECLVF